jgi:hypothetical protein
LEIESSLFARRGGFAAPMRALEATALEGRSGI